MGHCVPCQISDPFRLCRAQIQIIRLGGEPFGRRGCAVTGARLGRRGEKAPPRCGVGGCSDPGAGSRGVGRGEDGLRCWGVRGARRPQRRACIAERAGEAGGGYTDPSPGRHWEGPQP